MREYEKTVRMVLEFAGLDTISLAIPSTLRLKLQAIFLRKDTAVSLLTPRLAGRGKSLGSNHREWHQSCESYQERITYATESAH